jgi:hypothetical protein
MSQPQDTTAAQPAPAAPPAQQAPTPAPAPSAPEAPESPRDMRARIAEQNRRLAELEAERDQWKTKATETQTRYAQDLVMVKAGGNFHHPSVQRVVRSEYAEYVREAGANAKPFDEWFVMTETRSNPVIGVHFTPAAPAGAPAATPAAAAPTPPAPPPANPNAHTAPNPTPGKRYTRDQLAEIRKANDGRLPKHVLDELNGDGIPVK